MKTAKVTEVVENFKQFTTQNGQFYVHIITMDNGDKGEYNSKSQTCSKFVKGQTANYEFTAGQGNYLGKIKPVQEQQSGNSGKFNRPANQDLILAQTCIKASCEYYGERQGSTMEVLEFADSLFVWCKAKSNTL